MRPADLRARLRGDISFAPTPFTPDDRVDLDGLAEIVGSLVAPDGPVAVCGAVGEYPSLDLEEYRAVISVAAEATAGRVPLIVGIGHGTRIAATLAEHAARAGAEATRYAALGAEAFTSGLVNVAPDLTRAVRDGVAAERPDEVERVVAMIGPFAALRSRRPGYSVAVIKEAMALLGRPGGGRVRPSISPLLPDDREELRALLPVLGLAAVA